MSWYSQYMIKTSLRKNSLNADFHIHALEDPHGEYDIQDDIQIRHLTDIIGSAIIKGLDIIGIVSRHSYHPGELCKQIINEKKYDIMCLSGIEIETSEDIHVVVYDSKVIPKQGLSVDQTCRIAHKNGGVVMAIQPSRRNMQRLNKLVGTKGAPDFVEIFNDITQGGYSKSFIDTNPDPSFLLLMNSAARNARDLDKSMLVSRISRKFLVEKGVLGKDEGVDFTPEYLQNRERLEPVNNSYNPQGVV